MTRDGVLVLSHDPHLSPDLTRTADGRWIGTKTLAIKDLTYAELQQFDVGRLRPGSKTAKALPASNTDGRRDHTDPGGGARLA